jgi:hypothetical protein
LTRRQHGRLSVSFETIHAFAAALGLIAAALSSFVLMWMVMYFE